MTWTPYVGQHVTLSRSGYVDLSLDSREAFEQAKDMVITGVEQVGYHHDPVYVIHVNAPLINMFLLESSMLKPI